MSFFDNAKNITLAGKAVSKLELDGVVLWEAVTYKNWVRFSTEADGKTIYNGGKGYKDGYRVRSGGAEAEETISTATGYIPYRKGDRLYIYPPFKGLNGQNAVNFYNGEFACLGQVTDSGNYYGICTAAFKTTAVGGVSVLDLSSVTVSGVNDIAYVRITNCINGVVISSGAEMIITVNEEIPL